MGGRDSGGSAVSTLARVAGAAAAVGVVGAAAAYAYNAVSSRRTKREVPRSFDFDDGSCTEAFKQLTELFEKRIAYIDGAIGTSIEKCKLEEEDFRGERYKEHGRELKGNNDLLAITRPDVIEGIHTEFLNAGADIISTNTLNATTISMAEYELGTSEEVKFINTEAAKLAKRCTQRYMDAHPGETKFVAGAIGPTSETLSISPSEENPSMRGMAYDQVKQVRSFCFLCGLAHHCTAFPQSAC